MDLNAALAAWLTGALTSLSLAVYSVVPPLAGGPEGPVWRWVLVELVLFGIFLLIGIWWIRLFVMGRSRSGLGVGAVLAVVLGLIWNWYSVIAIHAVEQGIRPVAGWDWVFLTWGLPLTVAGVVLPTAGFIAQLGLAMAEAAVALLLAALLWAATPNPWGAPRPRRR